LGGRDPEAQGEAETGSQATEAKAAPMSDQRMIKIATLWERESKAGRKYFSGFMGDTQLLMFDAGEHDHPTKPGERIHTWRLMLAERDPARRPSAQSAEQAEP
jgi:hypothetical protein